MVAAEDHHQVVAEPFLGGRDHRADLVVDERDVRQVVVPQLAPVVVVLILVRAALDPALAGRASCGGGSGRVVELAVAPDRLAELVARSTRSRYSAGGSNGKCGPLNDTQQKNGCSPASAPIQLGGLRPTQASGCHSAGPGNVNTFFAALSQTRERYAARWPAASSSARVVVGEPHRHLLVVLQVEVVDAEAQVVLAERARTAASRPAGSRAYGTGAKWHLPTCAVR